MRTRNHVARAFAYLMLCLLMSAIALPLVQADGTQAEGSQADGTLVAEDEPEGVGSGGVKDPSRIHEITAPVSADEDDEGDAGDREGQGSSAESDASLAGTPISRLVQVPGPAPRPLYFGDKSAHGDELEFECPSPAQAGAGGAGQSSFTLYGCPLRVYDALAPATSSPWVDGISAPVGWLFGNVQLSVYPEDPQLAAFFSLHGSPADSEHARTDNARDALTHTTFTSYDNGLHWADQPTSSGFPRSGSIGESATGTMDNRGNTYSGYLWNDPDGRDNWRSQVGVFKSGTPENSNSVMESYSRGFFLDTRHVDHLIDRAHLTYVPPPEIEEEEDDDEGPKEPGEVGDDAIEHNETDLVALVWREEAIDWQNSSTGMSAWIDAMWTHTDAENRGDDWSFLPDEELIGPCRGISDPVVWEQEIYVACVVDTGYNERSRARVGDVDIWKIDPLEGTTEFVSNTGIIEADHVMLAVTSDGYFAVASSRVVNEQQVDVRVSMGWYASHWALRNGNIGEQLHVALGEVELRDAHVTALALTDDEKVLFMTYKEWNDVEMPTLRPDEPVPRLHDYKKIVVTMTENAFPLASAEFHMGEVMDGRQIEWYEEEPGIFNDRQDGLQYVRMPNGQERVFMAINDYGAVQFAGIVPPLAPGFGPQQPPPAPPPVVIPQAALGASTGVQTAVGSTIGLVAAAMVGYLLTVKRKNPLASAVEDNR